MKIRLTFGQKIAAGFAAVVLLALISSVVSIRALRSAVAEKDLVISDNAARLVDAQQFQGAMESKVASSRGYFLTGNEDHLARLTEAQTEVDAALRRISSHELSAEGRDTLEAMRRAEVDYANATNDLVARRKAGAPIEDVIATVQANLNPMRLALDRLVDEFVEREQQQLEAARDAASASARRATGLVVVILAVTILGSIILSVMLVRMLGRDIGAAIQHIRSSSTELQSAANQQVTSAREQATSMNEISTTVSELLATSRQIAESAKRVAGIAEETAGAAKAGDETVRSSQQSIQGIKQHVDHVVTYMLDLGKKSQQIGSVVDIIDELAEQTNILSVNASIEAAGAGENGRRFAVVADEIRKLAERVGGSTREITAIIEEIRAAVNTTVMATEGGSKAVDAGARQFSDVIAAFDHIVSLVATATEAAREIELSTTQQATAVEQVNSAIVSAAQATKESEASSGQTLQTAGQLATLSTQLAQLT